jgi:hypothetical protein
MKKELQKTKILVLMQKVNEFLFEKIERHIKKWIELIKKLS